MALEVQNPRPETRKGGVREDYRASLIFLISLVLLNRTPTVFFLDASILAAARLRFSRRILSSTILRSTSGQSILIRSISSRRLSGTRNETTAKSGSPNVYMNRLHLKLAKQADTAPRLTG